MLKSKGSIEANINVVYMLSCSDPCLVVSLHFLNNLEISMISNIRDCFGCCFILFQGKDHYTVDIAWRQLLCARSINKSCLCLYFLSPVMYHIDGIVIIYTCILEDTGDCV